MRGPGKRILRVNLPVFPGFRIGVRDDWVAASGAMTKARSPPAYGRKRKEKWRRGTNVGKRCLSRSVSVENLELYSQPNGCCKASPASSFSPDLAVIFQLSDISRELSFGFPFLLREKKRGGRAPQWPRRYCRLFSFGINSGYILDTASRTVSPRTAMRGPEKRILRVNLPVFLDPASSAG